MHPVAEKWRAKGCVEWRRGERTIAWKDVEGAPFTERRNGLDGVKLYRVPVLPSVVTDANGTQNKTRASQFTAREYTHLMHVRMDS